MNTVNHLEVPRTVEQLPVEANGEVVEFLRTQLDQAVDQLGRPTLQVGAPESTNVHSFAAGDKFSMANAWRSTDGTILSASIELQTPAPRGYKRTIKRVRTVSFHKDGSVTTERDEDRRVPVSTDGEVISFINEFNGIVARNTTRGTQIRNMSKRILFDAFDRSK